MLERTSALPNPELELLVVIVTRYDKRTNLARGTCCGQARDISGNEVFRPVIGKNATPKASPADQETLFTSTLNSSGTENRKRLAREVMQRVC